MEPAFILCGLGRVGWRVLEYLRAAGLPVVAVDTTCAADDPRLLQVRLVKGDCRRREILEAAGVAQARGVLILTSDDLVNISAALMVRRLHPDARVVIRMFNENLLTRLGKAVRNVSTLSTASLTAPLLALTAATGQALGAFRMEGVPESRRHVAEVTVSASSPLRGERIAALAARHGALVLAHLPAHGKDSFLLEVDLESRLTAGDRLVICGEPRQLARLLPQAGDESLPHVRWAGWLRRFSRVGWRTLAEIDLPVKICTVVLLCVVLASTLVYHLGVNKSLPGGLYRTISVMATGADMHEEELSLGWQKVFVSVLRILGAALTAAFTAIVTNYLLRARLGGALEVRRIPDSGHVLVCGLGNIGFRIVEELVQTGERVVVIEVSRDSRFVATARRLGVPVLIGDATVREVLRQAHAASARAVLATTSHDLVNLEVALLARELNPTQRAVVLLSDPHLAEAVRDAASVRFALSVPALAAPAFVAALFCDRVQSLFLVAGRLLAVVDLLIQAGDAILAGQTVRAVAVDHQLLPLAVLDAQGKLHPHRWAARLDAGSRLLAIMSLPDLERLQQRQPVPRGWAVEITAIPLPTRSWVALLLRNQQGTSAAAAESALENLPVCLASDLTRGQAEDLLAVLRRESVTATLRSAVRDQESGVRSQEQRCD
jgi:Trk K+ transport system NAD-binding subunit